MAKGRVIELYARVKSNDPANSAIILIPVETTGLEGDSSLIDSLTVAEVFDGATNEQTTMGRKTLTDAELAALPSPDTTNDRYEVSLPSVTWTGATGSPISKILVAYDPDTTGGSDSTLIPLTLFDAVATPDGNDLQLTGGVFFRAS